jgi:hypothetical protein
MAEDNIAAQLETLQETVKKHGLRYDPDWMKIATQAASEGDMPVPDKWADVYELRNFTETILGTIFRLAPYPEEVEETKTEFDSPDGTHKFTVSRFATAEQRAPVKEGEPLRPAVLASHLFRMLEARY